MKDIKNVPNWFVKSSLTDNQKDLVCEKWQIINECLNTPNKSEQFKTLAKELNRSVVGIKKHYFNTMKKMSDEYIEELKKATQIEQP